MDRVYDLFRAGTALLEAEDYHAATIPLGRARDLSPESSSIREALGRALFRSGRFSEAAGEFEAVAERHPTHDLALFSLGRALQMLGPRRETSPPLALPRLTPPRRHDDPVHRPRP